MTGLRIQFSGDGRCVVVELTGEIDLANAGTRTDEIPLHTPSTAEGVVVDLAGIRYLDSAGIRAVFQLRRGLELRSQALALRVPPDSTITRLLKASGVIEAIPVCPTVEEACAAVMALHER